jgi:hypothetical protein
MKFNISIWQRYDVDGININQSNLFKYARNLEFNKVELNVGSMVVTKILNDKDGGNPMVRSLVSLIRRMLDLEWDVTTMFSRNQSMCRCINYFWMFLRGWYALFCGLSISVWALALLVMF